jgi:hypothetical protein
MGYNLKCIYGGGSRWYPWLGTWEQDPINNPKLQLLSSHRCPVLLWLLSTIRLWMWIWRWGHLLVGNVFSGSGSWFTTQAAHSCNNRTHAPTTKTPPQLLPSEHICSVVEVARELQTRQKETSTNQSQQCREALSGVHACIAFSPRYNAARSNVSTTFAMAGQTSFPNVSQSHSWWYHACRSVVLAISSEPWV